MAIDATSIDELQKGVNDSAGKTSLLWTTFVSFELYLAIAFGSVRHQDLFLETPIRLPLLNVDLPLVGFFIVAPALLVIFHFYVFLQLLALSAKASDYNALLRAQAPVEADRQYMRQRLDPFLILQFLAGPNKQRNGMNGFWLRLIAWITLVGTPVLVLLQAQITFLPYHQELVVWLHRLAIFFDVVIIWYYWNRLRNDDDPFVKWMPDTAWKYVGAFLSLLIVLLSVWIATFPGERAEENLPPHFSAKSRWFSLHQFLFASERESVSGWPRSLFSNHLILTNLSFIDPDKIDKVTISRSFRGRDLRQAVLNGVDLRKSDLRGANLRGAKLIAADLRDAHFGCENPPDPRGKNSTPSDDSCTRLDGATLIKANLENVNLNGIHLEAATLFGACLKGAQLREAHLQGVQLQEANLENADFFESKLQGADLTAAAVKNAKFGLAKLQGANFGGADLSDGVGLDSAAIWRTYGFGKAGVGPLTAGKFDEATKPWDSLGGSISDFKTWQDFILVQVPNGVLREEAVARLLVLDGGALKEEWVAALQSSRPIPNKSPPQTFLTCIGELPSNCPPGMERTFDCNFAYRHPTDVIQAAAQEVCTGRKASVSSANRISVYGGNRCGYSVVQVTC
jgi:hypothetical protein